MEDLYDLLERAKVLMSLKRYADASIKLEKALGIDPVNTEILLLLGQCKLLLGRLEECKSLAEGVLGLNPISHEALSLLAKVYNAQGNTLTASIFIKQALSLDAMNVNYMAQLSTYLTAEEDEPAAVQVAVNALRIDARHVPSLAALGWAKFELDNYEESLEAFHQGLSLDPNNPVLLHHIGIVLRETGEPKGAKAMFLDALRNDPNFDDAALDIAGISYRSTLLYRIHYRLVYLFRESHVSRILFFTGAFLFLQSVAESAWDTYTVWVKLLVTAAWVFLLILLSVFIVPAAGNLPVIFKSQYRHLFTWKAKTKTISIFFLYILSIGLLIASWSLDQPAARWSMYGSLGLLIACLIVQTILGSGLSCMGSLLMIFLTGCFYTWLYLVDNIRFGHFYGASIMIGANVIGGGLAIFKKFRD